MPDVPSLCPLNQAAQYVPRTQAWLNDLAATGCVKTAGPTPFFKKGFRSATQEYLRQAYLATLKAGTRIPRLGAGVASLPIPDFVNLNAPDVTRLVITSISVMGRAGLLSLAAPESRFILVMRHPWGQIDSVLRGADQGTGVDIRITETEQARRRNLTADKLRALPTIAQLAWRWVIAHETVLEELANARHFIAVRLADLNHNPTTKMPPIFDFCGVPWTDHTSQFLDWSTTGTGKESFYAMKRDPTEATWGWRRRLSQAQIETISEIVFDSIPGRMFDVAPQPETAA